MEALPTFEWSRSPDNQARIIFRFINWVVEQQQGNRRYCMVTLFRAVLRRNSQERYTYGLAVQCLSRTLDSLNHAWDLRREEFVPIPLPFGQQQAPGECPICLESYEARALSRTHPTFKGHYRVKSRSCGHTFGSGCILHALGPFGAANGTCPYCRRRWAGGLGSSPIVVEDMGDLGLPDEEQLYQIALDLHFLYVSLLSNPPDWLTPTYRTWLDRERPRLIRVRHPNRQTRVLSWTDPGNEFFFDWTLTEGFLTAEIWIRPPPPVLTARGTLADIRLATPSGSRSIVSPSGLFAIEEIANTGLNHASNPLSPMVNIPPSNGPAESQLPDNNRSPADSPVIEPDTAQSATALALSTQSLINSMAGQTIQNNDPSPGPSLTPNSLNSTQAHAGAVTTSPDGLSPPIWHFIPPQAYDGTDPISSINRFVDESEHFEMYRRDPVFRSALDAFLRTLFDPDNPPDNDQAIP